MAVELDMHRAEAHISHSRQRMTKSLATTPKQAAISGCLSWS